MIILRPYEPRVLAPALQSQWREPSRAMVKDCFGNPEWRTRFRVFAKSRGRVVWQGWLDDRDDADAFLLAAVMGLLHIERGLCRLPDPIYVPGVHDADLEWFCATTTYYTSGTSWTVPSDWNNSDNEIIALGGGGNGGTSTFDGKNYNGSGGGSGGACSKATNVTYTASASRTMQVGGVATDSYLRDNSNSTNAVLAKGGQTGNSAGVTGGAAASGTGSTKYSGGNGAAVFGADGGGGGGAASAAGNGSNGSSGSGGNAGSGGGAGSSAGSVGTAGTNFGSGYGSGGGGGGSVSQGAGYAGGNYGAGGGGQGASPSGTGGAGKQGLVIITYTAGAAASFKAGFNMPNGW